MSVGGKATDETYVVLGWDLLGEKTRPAVRELGKKYFAKYNEAPGILVPFNYAGAEMVFEAMRRVGTTDVEKLKDVLATEKFMTVVGPTKFGGKETYGIDRALLHPVVISVYRGGKVIDLDELVPFGLR